MAKIYQLPNASTLQANDYTIVWQDGRTRKVSVSALKGGGDVSWNSILDKPAVIASGNDAVEARASIGAASVSSLSGKVDKEEGKGLSSNDYTSAEKTKLAGIAAGATANSTDAQLRDRSTHTGTQAIATVTGLQAALDARVDKEAGKGLSSNDYTSAEKTKLAGIAANANNYVHPASHPPSIIVQDVNNRFVSDSEKSTWNNKQPALVSGTNIKTLNGVSLLGAGNITIEVPDTNINNSITTNYANGRIEQITIDGITHHIFYNGEGRVSQVVYPYKGKTRTETFTYNPDGTFQGMTATEV